MATSTAIVNPGSFGQTPAALCSLTGAWATCIANIEATANTSTELRRPLSITNSNNVLVRVGPNSTSFLLRAKYPVSSAITTSPVVRAFGVYGEPTFASTPSYAGTDAAFATDGTNKFIRLDADSGSGQTLTLTEDVDIEDTTYAYSPPWSVGLRDLRGAQWLIVVLETSAVHGGSGGTVEALILN